MPDNAASFLTISLHIALEGAIPNLRIYICRPNNAACMVISIDFPCDIAVFDDSTFRIAE